MIEESREGRLWSDGQSVYRLASMGVRLFAGVLDWVFAVGFAAIVGSVLAAIYNGIVAEYRTISYLTSIVVVFTLVHIASAIMVFRRGDTPGNNAVRLVVKRDDAGRIGWARALVRRFVGTPGLSVPWVAIALQNVIVFGVETSSAWFGTSDSLAESLGGYGFAFWSATLTATWIAVLVLVLLNHAWMVFDAKHRGIHDLIVGTVVVGDRVVRKEPDAMTTLAADRTRGDLDYPTAHRVF